MSSKINFIKLTNQELSNKVALLVLNKARVIFWKTSPRYYEGNAISYSDDGKLILKTKALTIRIIDEQICLNFSLNQMEYFVKGKVISQVDAKEELEVELLAQCFRVEKRDYQRVQVYPLYDVYAYLKYSEEKKENIFFINKNDQKKNDLLTNIRDLEKQKLAQISRDLQTGDNEELLGFRVEDLSSVGLCFLASLKEKEQIISRFVGNSFNLILNFGTASFQLKNVQVIYQVNYINQQFAGVPMYKIGVAFQEDLILKAKIQELIGHDDKILDYPKEFDEFIKNE